MPPTPAQVEQANRNLAHAIKMRIAELRGEGVAKLREAEQLEQDLATIEVAPLSPPAPEPRGATAAIREAVKCAQENGSGRK